MSSSRQHSTYLTCLSSKSGFWSSPSHHPDGLTTATPVRFTFNFPPFALSIRIIIYQQQLLRQLVEDLFFHNGDDEQAPVNDIRQATSQLLTRTKFVVKFEGPQLSLGWVN